MQDDGQQTQAVPLEVVTLDDVHKLVDNALSDYYERQDLAMESYCNDVSGGIDAVNDSVGALSSKVDALAANVDDSKEAQENLVVTLDEGQWTTVQRCWGWGKAAGQVALFLELVILLMVCTLLGTRLWDAFSKGWRK